jgi:glycine oxidase
VRPLSAQQVPSVAVVGAGIVGMSIAWRLAQLGFAVTVFERGEPGQEASWAGAGMLAPGGEMESASPLAMLAIEARQQYKSFVNELEQAAGFHIDYQECGALELCYSTAEIDALTSKGTRQVEFGIRSKPLSNTDIHAFWPRVATHNLTGGRFYPDDAIVDPRELLQAVAIACRKLAVQFVPGAPVRRLSVSDREVTVHATQSDSYDAAVVAAGAWSSEIEVTGVPALPTAEPVKGHLIGYVQPAQTCNTILRHLHSYILQRANGMLIVGASVERVGFDRSVDSGIVDALARRAGIILPHLAETTPSEAWIGFRPASETLQVGPWHSSRLYLAYGHFRNGILLAPVTAARAAADLSASLQRQ